MGVLQGPAIAARREVPETLTPGVDSRWARRTGKKSRDGQTNTLENTDPTSRTRGERGEPKVLGELVAPGREEEREGVLRQNCFKK